MQTNEAASSYALTLCLAELQMPSVSSKQPVKVDMLHILLSLLVLCYGVTNSHCSTVNESSQDFLSLLDFKQGITSDPRGALSNWTMSSGMVSRAPQCDHGVSSISSSTAQV
jgi:hypothetical protein